MEDRWMNERMDGGKERRDEWRMDGGTNGQMDRWTNGWMALSALAHCYPEEAGNFGVSCS